LPADKPDVVSAHGQKSDLHKQMNRERPSAAVPRENCLMGLSPADLALLGESDFNKESNKMSEHMAGMVRHVLTSIGGLMIMMGYADEATVTAVVGAAITLMGFAWSWMSK
jgi:hypothetical protein